MALAILGKLKSHTTNKAQIKQTKNFQTAGQKTRVRPDLFIRPIATPKVISIKGIAICPINSSVFVKKLGVRHPLVKKTVPSSTAGTKGSLSTLIGEPRPDMTHTPNVKL